MTHNIDFNGGTSSEEPTSFTAGAPLGTPAAPFNPSASSATSGGKPSPMDLASQSQSGPVGEYQEPPVPSLASAPKSPIPPPIDGTLTNFSIKNGVLKVSLQLPTGSSWWATNYDYQAPVTPGQTSALQNSSSSSLADALSKVSPPIVFSCTNASNALTHFPSNLSLFSKEFPYEYRKFLLNIETQIFMQIHSQQAQAINQMKKTMQEMEQD